VRAFKERHGSDRGFRAEAAADGAVRLRVPDDGATVVHDVVLGDTVFEHLHLDDPVIARADGSVLYNFAVAVDDLDAGITHVVRGNDHLSNTPKQLLVIKALGAADPTGRSSPSATAPPRSRSCAMPAICPRRSATTLPCWAGAATTTPR
jgi:glutamyl/glutaminyl-tRNA synthetase